MAEESLRRLVATALERLTVNQATQGWARHLKAPDVFKPDSRDNELKLWGDWKFSLMNYIKGIDPTMANDMDLVERDLEANYDMDDMTDETKGRAVRFYSLLTSYLRQRPLKLIRHVKKENGFEAWQILLREVQPATRARALALLSQLPRIQFAEGKTVSEQLPQFEALINEYERISGHGYSDDAKVAAVLLACPMQIRQRLHLWITDTTTYEQLKNRIIQLEAVTTKWDSTNSFMLPTRASTDEATPMEVDYVGKAWEKGGKKAKGKMKGKDKGKSKDGKGSWKSYEKGKSTWEKGPGKKGKPTEKGSKGGKSTGACHLCGNFAKDGWKRVNQIEEQTNPGGASSSSTGAGPSTAQGSTANVKMVRIETPPGTPSMEVFDLTTPRGSGDNFPWRVGMIRWKQDEDFETAYEEYMECHEPRVDVPAGVSIVAMDLQDDEDFYVNMVKIEGVNADNCLVTLDTGADVSVLPRTYASVGQWQQGSSELKMIDAQGKRIAHDGATRVRIRIEDKR